MGASLFCSSSVQDRTRNPLIAFFTQEDLRQTPSLVLCRTYCRSGDEISIFSDVLVSYAMTTVELFKGEPIDAQRLTITTASSSAACGVFMELEEEYLIGANRNANGQFQTSICSLFRLWSGVTEEELALLASGCADDDGCDDAAALVPNGCGDTCGGRCGEFQVGVQGGLVSTAPNVAGRTPRIDNLGTRKQSSGYQNQPSGDGVTVVGRPSLLLRFGSPAGEPCVNECTFRPRPS